MSCIGHKDALNLEGKYIDKYQFCRLIEHGEHVSVYLGHDTHKETSVAIKVVHCAYADEACLQLLNEKALLTVLVYPRIVRMLDFVVSSPFILLVTEYAARGSLRDCLSTRTKLSMSTRINYISQAAEALQYMHNQGYIHRDVKPENMLLTLNDDIILCDLGIAMSVPSGNERVNSIGTASYVAPEQIHGYPSQKSDQYSLAIVAYELFCGIRPFSGSSSRLIWKQLLLDPPLSHSRCKKLPPAAEQVIRQALSKDPDQRFSRIETFALELEDALCSPSLPPVTDEIECMPKAQKATDIVHKHVTDYEQPYPHTSIQHLESPNTTSLE